jgi:arylsulfatase
MKRNRVLGYGRIAFLVATMVFFVVPAHAADKKPNILVIWGDDIGRDNISAYS